MIFRNSVIEHKMCALISLQLLSKIFLIIRRTQDIIMYIGFHVKYRYSYQILMKLEFARQIFEKYWNIKFHENPSDGNRTVPCGRTDREIYMTKLIVASRNFSKAPKTECEGEEWIQVAQNEEGYWAVITMATESFDCRKGRELLDRISD
jgi:hypothetical protein